MNRAAAQPAFTLAELLIALVILGVIATFTIPKVLTAGQDQSANAKAKEFIASVSGALQTYKAQNPGTTTITNMDLTPYLNYVAIYTTGVIDETPAVCAGPTLVCLTINPCVQLHSGAKVRFRGDSPVDLLDNRYAMPFHFDPDGVLTDVTGNDGPGKTIDFFLYTDGKVRTYGTIDPNTPYNTGAPTTYVQPAPARDPSWFHWN